MDDESLRRLALAATPGEWHAPGLGEIHRADHMEIAEITFAVNDPDSLCGTEADAAYIAAANPQTVLSLLDRLAAAELDAGRIEALEQLTYGPRDVSIIPPGQHGGQAMNFLLSASDYEKPSAEWEAPTLRGCIDAAIKGTGTP